MTTRMRNTATAADRPTVAESAEEQYCRGRLGGNYENAVKAAHVAADFPASTHTAGGLVVMEAAMLAGAAADFDRAQLDRQRAAGLGAKRAWAIRRHGSRAATHYAMTFLSPCLLLGHARKMPKRRRRWMLKRRRRRARQYLTSPAKPIADTRAEHADAQCRRYRAIRPQVVLF